MSELGFVTASWPRRVGALTVDWFASTMIVIGWFGWDRWLEDPRSGLVTMGVYVVESVVFTTLLGGSFGKLATRLRVVRIDGTGRPLDPIRALVRTLLVCVVIPPLVFKPDGRGLHDLAVGTATVPLSVARLGRRGPDTPG